MQPKLSAQLANGLRLVFVLSALCLAGCHPSTPMAPLAQQPLPVALTIPGVVLYYPFSGTAQDLSGKNVNGEVQGAVLTPDRFGVANHAYYFDGVDDSIYFDASNMPLGSSARTLSAWVKAESYPPAPANLKTLGSRATVIGWGLDGPKTISEMQIVDRHLQFHDYLMDRTGKEILETGKWYHLVIVYTEQSVQLYVNGNKEIFESSPLNTLVGKGRIGAFPDQTATSQFFPQGYDLSYFHGSLDDISVYDQALSEAWIQALYTEGGWGK